MIRVPGELPLTNTLQLSLLLVDHWLKHGLESLTHSHDILQALKTPLVVLEQRGRSLDLVHRLCAKMLRISEEPVSVATELERRCRLLENVTSHNLVLKHHLN